MGANCYLVYDENSKKAIIIDPGDEADFVIGKILGLRLKPIAQIATHGHFDHIMAVFELGLAFKVPFFASLNDEVLIKKAAFSARRFTHSPLMPISKIGRYLGGGDMIKFGGESLKIIETPGHTPGGICLYSKKAKVVFSGDLIFEEGGLARSDFSYSYPLQLKASIKKVLSLPKNTMVYPGHGQEFLLGKWKES